VDDALDGNWLLGGDTRETGPSCRPRR
jgi:hypothetical protein